VDLIHVCERLHGMHEGWREIVDGMHGWMWHSRAWVGGLVACMKESQRKVCR
jgi:hypothetical protein